MRISQKWDEDIVETLIYNNRHLYIRVWQFGGVGTIHLDYDLAPFVKLSFYKHFANGLKYIENYPDTAIDSWIVKGKEFMRPINDEQFKLFPKAYEYAIDMLEKEGQQATQALYHNLNTLESRQGSQVK